MNTKSLWVLYFCLFLVMVGFGITLPVFPFYAERTALSGGISTRGVALQVGLLTSVYVLMQFVFAPLWGKQSDRMGRKPLILVGVAGYGIGQLLFGLSTSLSMLYGARVIGGILSAALLPAASSYVADMTLEKQRAAGMAWLGAMTSLGVVVGPSLGGLLGRNDLHFVMRYGHFMLDRFSVPFFAAGGLAIATLPIVLRWLPESQRTPRTSVLNKRVERAWGDIAKKMRPLLTLTSIGQFGLASFAATFTLYAQQALNYGPVKVGAAFTVCGLVMALSQIGVVSFLAKHLGERYLLATGFTLMGAGFLFLQTAKDFKWVLSAVGVMALGVAFITPTLLALVSKVEEGHTGAALGLQNAASSLGQTLGPLFGTFLFSWREGAPFLVTGLLLMVVGLLVVRVDPSSRLSISILA